MANPCEGTRLPTDVRPEVVPPTTEQVNAIADAMPDELRALVTFVAGTGVRQGEALGLTLDRLDMLRRTIRIDRQLVGVDGLRPRIGPPKTKATVRTIPLPHVVVDVLAAHLAAYPPADGPVFTLDGLAGHSTAFRAPVAACGG